MRIIRRGGLGGRTDGTGFYHFFPPHGHCGDAHNDCQIIAAGQRRFPMFWPR